MNNYHTNLFEIHSIDHNDGLIYYIDNITKAKFYDHVCTLAEDKEKLKKFKDDDQALINYYHGHHDGNNGKLKTFKRYKNIVGSPILTKCAEFSI